MSKVSVNIVAFNAKYTAAFRRLNLAWVTKYFAVEPMDEAVLSNPQQEIIDKGGFIYFVLMGEEVAGTFALLKMSEGVYELSKMAVDETWQGQKIGNAILDYCLKVAKQIPAHKIILYSNTILAPAIYLYKKFGFVEVPLLGANYKRANIKMEIDIL